MQNIFQQHNIVRPIWLHEKQLGFRKRLGLENKFYKALYSSISPYASWDHHDLVSNEVHGRVLNFDFSADGSLLIAACQQRKLLMFDPLTQKLINSVGDAHVDSVNCVRFLNTRTFATCSDDRTVKLWDARNLKKNIRTLYGHSRGIKNIEYYAKDDLLVTSGFDSNVYVWDMKLSWERLTYQRAFQMNGLTRIQLSPDSSKMVICTTGGYIIIIHNLDLTKLAYGLQGFKPYLYRLMQMANRPIRTAVNYSHLFSLKQRINRVEFITDFPPGNNAETMTALQIHPMGWCCLSRNLCPNNQSEWSCVHNIQEQTPEEIEKFETDISKENNRQYDRQGSSIHMAGESRASVIPFESEQTNPSTSRAGSPPGPDHRPSSAITWEALFTDFESRIRRGIIDRNPTNTLSLNNMLEIFNLTTGGLARNENIESRIEDDETEVDEPGSSQPSTSSAASNPSSSRRTKIKKRAEFKITYNNYPRLTHFIDELNVDNEFIKEPCFSSDGRLICSPYGNGIRLLAFSPECSEMSTCLPNEGPVRLFELRTNVCHSDTVISSKFSPTHQLLVTGCLKGKICWHQPVL